MRPRPRRPWPNPLGLSLPLPLLALMLAAGCEEPRHARTDMKAPAEPPAAAPAPAPEVVQRREVLGKKTMDIRDADAELKKGAIQGTTKITAKDPITLPGNAYVTTVGRLGIMQIESAVNLFRASEDRYPKDYQEFMARIIKENNIALPQLPFYQEYGYNAAEHKLIILEYPDRKAQLQKQDDARYGR